MSNAPVHYQIDLSDFKQHIYQVTLTVQQSSQVTSKLTLPAWIPGSYMIRDFAKNIVTLSATTLNGAPLCVEQTDKQTWLVANQQQGFKVIYQVYAFDTSVRTAYLDQFRGFFNGTSLFIQVAEFSQLEHKVSVAAPEALAHWILATGLNRLSGQGMFDFGDFSAPDYLTLIDHPFEMADFSHIRFDVYDIPHYVVLSGRHNADMQRIADDLSKICKLHLDYFGKPYPIDQYLFMVNIVGDGFGGLEHLNSTALLCSRKTLPLAGETGISEDYEVFLSLCSHEYFHTWNVKRIKPAEFVQPDIGAETYTKQLWFYEGITSYIDDISLNQANLIDAKQYLTTLTKQLQRLSDTPGRLVQSVTSSSFDAWTKFYKQDENASNAIVSYYNKGAVIALCLDLTIRQQTQHQFQLRDVMRHYWQLWAAGNRGTKLEQFCQVVSEVTSIDLSEQWQLWVNGTDELPFIELLSQFGVETTSSDKQTATPSLGFKWKAVANNVQITTVDSQGLAAQAGLSAQDQIIAINGLKVKTSELEKELTRLQADTTLTIHAFRRDELFTTDIVIPEQKSQSLALAVKEQQLAETWLKFESE